MKTVGDVLELAYGKALKAEDRSGGSVPVVGSGGIVGSHSVAITEGQTVVVGRKGSIGSVTWIDGPAWPIDTAYYVKAKELDLDLRWTYWMLKSLPLASMNKSAAVPGLNRDDVYRLPISVPCAAEQRRIAAILDRADAIRAKRRQIVAQFDSLADSVFADMFGGSTAQPRVALQDLTTLVTKGTTPTTVGLKFSEHAIPFLRAQNLQRGSVSFGVEDLHIDQAAHDELRRSWIYPGDLLISIAGTIGRVALAPGDSPTMNCNQAVAIVRLVAPETGPWVRAWLNTSDARSQIGASAVTGTISNLSLGQIRQLKIPRIPRVDIDEYVRRCAELASAQSRLDTAVEADDELFASLQARAFRGEL